MCKIKVNSFINSFINLFFAYFKRRVIKKMIEMRIAFFFYNKQLNNFAEKIFKYKTSLFIHNNHHNDYENTSANVFH